MWFENINKILLLCAGNLKFCPGRKYCHLNHHLGVRAQTFQIADRRCLRIICIILEMEGIQLSDILLEKFSRAETRSLSILPIRSTSVTIPVAINVAQTLTASAANSGEESAAKAGVRAEPIWAWYCSSSEASAKSGSGVLPKI